MSLYQQGIQNVWNDFTTTSAPFFCPTTECHLPPATG